MKLLRIFVIYSLCLLTPILMEAKEKNKITERTYEVPSLEMVTQNSETVDLNVYLKSGKTVLIDFIFTTCTTVCPVLSAGFSNFQKKVGPEMDNIHLVSISIDPDHDKPEIMKEYLERYNAKPGWDYLTADREVTMTVLKAFDAFVQDKVLHYPIILIRHGNTNTFTRIEGFISTNDLIEQYNKVVKK